jgi:uncharacterized protein (DUF488 family)
MNRRQSQLTRGGIVGVSYEGRTVAEFVTGLRLDGVQIVVDARLVPRCNRRGFSRHALAETLRANGIQYVHYEELGNPEPYQVGFRAPTEGAAAAERYREHLALPAVRGVIRDLIAVSASRKVGVMTVDLDQDRMQRPVLLDEIERCRPGRVDIDNVLAEYDVPVPDPATPQRHRDRLQDDIDALLAEFE